MRHIDTEINDKPYKIIAVDDEQGILDSLSILLKHSGYTLVGLTDPIEAIERVKNEHFDLMILDFIMTPIHGDKVVEEIRKFDQSIYILMLTGHKDLVPPLETIRKLSIQGYCEKSNNFDQLLLLIESAIKSIEQVRTINNINEELKASEESLENAYLDSIQVLRHTVEAKDPYTKGHSDRVSAFSCLIGKKLGLNDDDLKTLEIGGYIHDIGKIGVPDSIILKNGSLTDEEYKKIQEHPTIGKNILSNASVFEDAVPIVYYHHERYDGTGYPEGLKGEDIPLLARITSVSDAFDAMTSSRSYRNAIPLDDVKKELYANSGKQFDPHILDVFLDILNNNYDKIKDIQNKFQK